MKIEFDLPNFEKEININITIRKDGEVVYTTAASSSSPINVKPALPEVKKEQKKVTKEDNTKPSNGNFMNLDF